MIWWQEIFCGKTPEIRLHILITLAECRRNIKRKANSEEVRDFH